MGLKEKLADEIGASTAGLINNSGLYNMTGAVPAAGGTGETGVNLTSALSASTVFIAFLGIMPKNGKLVRANYRNEKIGVNSATITLYKCSSAASLGTLTSIATQIIGTSATSQTVNKFAPHTDGTENCAIDDAIYCKIVTVALETLTPLQVSLNFRI